MEICMANVEFTSTDCGNQSGTTKAEGEPLAPGDTVAVNGSTDLSKCIVGNKGACVYSINLINQAGFFNYVLNVVAQGPAGIGSGWLNLYFTDQSGDKYSLGIYSSTKQQHTVAYNSGAPDIVSIEWGA
jgi:hypothetical protein